MSKPHLCIIVATDTRHGIGINNTLPWHLPEDLAHFKRTTTGHTIVMGRKTFDSIGRPLPNRRNIVVTRNRDWQHDGVESAASLAQAAALAAEGKNGTSDTNGAARTYIIGGAQIYAEALPLASSLIVTEVDGDFGCDAFFPAIDPALWRETAREPHISADGKQNYSFVTYEKNR